jgi:hypothetical protein
MRVVGLNLVAILVAALAIYAIGFLVYGLIFGATWQALSGFGPDSFKGLEWRMALGPVMPILTAIGIALAIKWRNAQSLAGGVVTGLLVFAFITFAGRLYGFAYGNEPEALLVLDSAHLALTHVVAGAILGVWK